MTMATVGPKAGTSLLPPEIVSELIANINIKGMTYPQIANLWVATCQVSKQFAQEIPKVLGRKLLRLMTIEYKVGEHLHLINSDDDCTIRQQLKGRRYRLVPGD